MATDRQISLQTAIVKVLDAQGLELDEMVELFKITKHTLRRRLSEVRIQRGEERQKERLKHWTNQREL